MDNFCWGSVIVLAIAIVISMIMNNRKEEVKKNDEFIMKEYIKNSSIQADYMVLGDDSLSGMAIDASSKTIYLLKTEVDDKTSERHFLHRRISYKDILSSEIIEDGDSVIQSTLQGAAIGGILLGGVGALVGGASGANKKRGKVEKVSLKLIVNNVDDTTHTVCFLCRGVRIKRSHPWYVKAFKEAEAWQTRMDVIIKQTERELAQNMQSPPNEKTENSVADELKKLAKLKEQGILTEKEFNDQKMKLLE